MQFRAIIFCRTFKNYFGQFVWIEKKRKATILVAFHFMKRRLKIHTGWDSNLVYIVFNSSSQQILPQKDNMKSTKNTKPQQYVELFQDFRLNCD